jgi:hypothetical protein
MFGLFNFGGGTFEANYRCYPVSFLDKLDAENGDKIFLPPSALDRLGMPLQTFQLHLLEGASFTLTPCLKIGETGSAFYILRKPFCINNHESTSCGA